MNELVGKEIRGYRFLESLGAGGMGVVYRAHQPSVDREVAIKVILPEFVHHPDFNRRFEDEARMVAKLEHPHIVPLYDYWQDESGAFLVQRYLKGGSLRDRLEAEGALEVEQVSDILEQVCAALEVAHHSGVIHRDLKPENILMDERGEAYLTDFGIAKDLSADALTKTGHLTGSAGYLAPEQALSDPITSAVDIYSLGILVFELLTGQHPFPDLTPVQLIQHHLNQPLPPLRGRQPDLPEDIDRWIQQATAKLPEDRFKDVIAMARSFRASLGTETPTDGKELPDFLRPEGEVQEPVREVFVGCEEELEFLRSRLSKALTREGQITFITGGPGSGKTALSLEFAVQAQREYTDLLFSIGIANAFSGVGDPYLPFREIMGILTGELESPWAAGQLTNYQAQSLWKRAPQNIAALIDHGPDLFDVFVDTDELVSRAIRTGAPEAQVNALRGLANPGSQGNPRSLQQTQIFEQYTSVLHEIASNQPLLILLDDLQWADGASINLLFHLGRKLKGVRIYLIGTYREEEVALGREGQRHPLEKVVGELRMSYGDIRLDLEGDHSGGGRKMLEDLLDSEPNQLDSTFRDSLFNLTGGHPLFTIELLRSMQERGDLIKDKEGKWIAGDTLDWRQLPGKVEAVIEERVHRLEPKLQELLSVASVEGDEFTAQVAGRIQEIPERTTLHQLSQELEKRHKLIRERGEVIAGSNILSRYRFGHHLFQHYLYHQLGLGERRLLHGEVAHTLQELYGGQDEEISVQLARHYQLAGEIHHAVENLSRAGHRARRLYANQEAFDHFNHALDLAEKGEGDFYDLLKSRAEVSVELYRGEQAVRDYQMLLERARVTDDDQEEMEALLGLAHGNYIISLDHPETGAAEASQRFYKEAYEKAKGIEDHQGMIRALVPTVWFTDFWPDYADQARANSVEALKISQSVDDQELRIEAELAMFYTDPLTERQARGERLLKQLEEIGELTRLNYLLFGLMFSTLAIGDFEKTVEHCNRGIALAERIGLPPVQYPTIRSIALARLGRFDEALDSLTEEIADEAHRLGRAFRELGRAIIFFELQDFHQAAEVLLDLITPAEDLARAWMLDSIHLYLTRVVLEGDLTDAVDLDPSLNYLKEMDSAQALVALGELAVKEGDLNGALEYAERAVGRASQEGRRPEAAVALELKSWVLQQVGEPEAALEAVEAGIELAAQTGYRPLMWRLMGIKAEALEALSRVDHAHAIRMDARRLIHELAQGVSDPELKRTFLNSPAVRALAANLEEGR